MSEIHFLNLLIVLGPKQKQTRKGVLCAGYSARTILAPSTTGAFGYVLFEQEQKVPLAALFK